MGCGSDRLQLQRKCSISDIPSIQVGEALGCQYSKGLNFSLKYRIEGVKK